MPVRWGTLELKLPQNNGPPFFSDGNPYPELEPKKPRRMQHELEWTVSPLILGEGISA